MTSTSWLLVGLGNPGRRYQKTRHNLGFLFLDYLASSVAAKTHGWESDQKRQCDRQKMILADRPLILCKPTTFMNRTGEAVQPLAAYYEIPLANIIVVQDDLDLAFGRLKVKLGGGAGGHKGIESIASRLGSPEFIRFRLGIGDRGSWETTDYVLAKFAPTEWAALPSIFFRLEKALELLIIAGLDAAMTNYNADPLDG